MDKATFLQLLAQDQFPEPVLVVRDPGSMDEHCHPFESKALIMEGSLCLTMNGMTKRIYRRRGISFDVSREPFGKLWAKWGSISCESQGKIMNSMDSNHTLRQHIETQLNWRYATKV